MVRFSRFLIRWVMCVVLLWMMVVKWVWLVLDSGFIRIFENVWIEVIGVCNLWLIWFRNVFFCVESLVSFLLVFCSLWVECVRFLFVVLRCCLLVWV